MGFLFSLVPGLGFLVFSTKVVGLVPAEAYQRWFFAADWTQLFAGNVQVINREKTREFQVFYLSFFKFRKPFKFAARRNMVEFSV